MVLPMKGIQWKTIGGSAGLLTNNWWRTLPTIATTRNERKAAPKKTAVDSVLSRLRNGSVSRVKKPIARTNHNAWHRALLGKWRENRESVSLVE